MAGEEIRRAMVVAAHPDDTEFGCGGTLALWVRQGREVYYLVCTRGDKGSDNPNMTPDRLALLREEEQRRAAATVGVKEVVFLDRRDGELENSLDLRRDIVFAIRKYRPDAVFTHDPTTLIISNEFINHPDHRAAGLTALDAIYPTARDRLQFPEHAILGLEPHKVLHIYLWGSEQPNEWVDISQTIDTKVEALRQHQSQFENFARVEEFIRQRARQYGNPHGMEYAEAFRHVTMWR